MNAQKATKIRSEITQNIKEGKGPQTLSAKRELVEAEKKELEQQKQKESKEQFTFGQLAEMYLDWAKANKKSWEDDVQRYNRHLKPFLSKKPLKTISPFALEKLKSDLQKKATIGSKKGEEAHTLSPATVKHCLVLVRQMFNKAEAWGHFLGSNPVKKVKLPTLNNKRLRFLCYEEADMILQELKKRSQTTHDLALLSLRTGARFDEMAKLTWQDIDFNNGLIHLEGKNSETRQAFMTPDVVEMFERRKENLPPEQSELIFQSRKDGGKINKVSHAFWRTIEDLGFNKGITDTAQKVVFHTLRHSFASWLALQGTPIYTIKELMGHKTMTMTERYMHLAPDQKREAIDKMMLGVSTNAPPQIRVQK
ncbi:MAG: site-specific integrase [Desulfobulbaceae bacterium]|nr:site-specific integrase [Desulfobulbaceae bacterium]